MESAEERGRFVRKALMVALILAIVISPFFYHLVSFLLYPIIIPLIVIFAFVYFTGLTNFERKRMIKLNIALAILIIALYEGYLYFVVTAGSHSDIHLNVAVWLVQILAVNFLLILYYSFKSLKKGRKENPDTPQTTLD